MTDFTLNVRDDDARFCSNACRKLSPHSLLFELCNVARPPQQQLSSWYVHYRQHEEECTYYIQRRQDTSRETCRMCATPSQPGLNTISLTQLRPTSAGWSISALLTALDGPSSLANKTYCDTELFVSSPVTVLIIASSEGWPGWADPGCWLHIKLVTHLVLTMPNTHHGIPDKK